VERAIRRLLPACSADAEEVSWLVSSGVVIARSRGRFSQSFQLPSPGPRQRASSRKANIKQQKKRVLIQERQRTENLRYRSTIKTLTKRLESAVSDGDADRIASEHRELVRTIDRAISRGALHRNTAARKKSQAARLVAAS
jgi:small subunit ribosomal protein S20